MQTRDIVKKVKQIEIRTKKKSEAALMGQYHSAMKGQGMTFSEVRPYQFGDEIRRIDWNKTARFREPFVKVMEEERELTILLMVDTSASMNYGSRASLKREMVAEIAASLGFSAVGNNDKVGLILYADKVYKVIPPSKGRKHVLAIISNILAAEYVATPADFSVALQYLMNVFRKKSFGFIFSDFNDDFQQRTLKVAAKKHSLLALNVVDEKDFVIPDVGYVQFLDAESGHKVWVNTSSKQWRTEYENSKKQKFFRTGEIFKSASAGYLQLTPGDDYAVELYKYFQQR